MGIKNEKEICEYLKIPSIPKKKWDGKTNYDKGVSIAETTTGEKMYLVTSYKETDTRQKVLKVFSVMRFIRILETYVVPDYMSDISDIDDMDLDEKSKENAERLLVEAEIMENDFANEEDEKVKNEYYFDFITNDEEAKAFIAAYNEKNKIEGRIPKEHNAIVMRLAVIYKDSQNKKNE